MTATLEQLGPAERILQTLLTHTDHLVHGRPGVVVPDRSRDLGIRWEAATHKQIGKDKTAFLLTKVGKKNTEVRIGVIREDGKIVNGLAVIGEYRPAGILPEAAVWMYHAVAEVWKIDNEFAARWASHSFGEEHRDLKVVLCAFMLVQSRKGDPVIDGGKVVFYDEDYRDVGEAMALLIRKDNKDLNPKLLLRIYEILCLPQIAAINRELGFGKSARNPHLGRWPEVARKWLRYREENPKLLEGLVKAGFTSTVKELARRSAYKPLSPKFFETLRWKQSQAKDGHRTIRIGEALVASDSWAALSEAQICEKIVAEKLDWKRIVGLLPKEIGASRAVISAAVEAGSMSNKDLIILTPTLEELGLLQVKEVKEKWERAIKKADDDMRAMNIAKNVRSKEVQEKLQGAADTALQKTIDKVTKNLRIYVMVDISGSMQASLDRAKTLAKNFLQGFPIDRTHIVVFNTVGRIVEIKHASAAGVENAFKGIQAGGGTSHAAGVLTFVGAKKLPLEDEDVIFIWIGDGGERGSFDHYVNQSGLRPTAFGFLQLPGENYGIIERTATALNIPCFKIDEATFSDVYAIPRTIRNLIAATPVGVVPRAIPTRTSLVQTILKTELLKIPQWAAVGRAVPKAA